MARQVSIVVVYPAETMPKSIRRALEGVFDAKLDISDHYPVGGAYTCIIDVQVPDGLKIHIATQRLEAALPTVSIRMMERFRESWWRRHRWNIAIAIGGGIAVAFIVDLVRSSAERLREALG